MLKVLTIRAVISTVKPLYHPNKRYMVIEKLGRYEVVSELGQGAMGVVYKSIDPLIDRTVAIKTINLNLSKEELADFEARFYREAQSAGRLNHPNIVTIHDVGKTDAVAYMAMEFLEGQELRGLLAAGRPLEVERAADMAAQVAEGLAYAHEHGVVHRDIKPANIMIVRNGLVKITDFGIALMPSASRTLAGMVLGSPKYMSPEQVLGQTIDGRSDIFSLGVVLYEMLTGQSPFSGDNLNTIMYRILNETPVPPSLVNENVPEAFDTIIAKALSKRPEDRYQNAKVMARDLREYLSAPQVASEPVSRPAQTQVPQFNTLSVGEATAAAPIFRNDATAVLQRVSAQPLRPVAPAPLPMPVRTLGSKPSRAWLYAGVPTAVALAAFATFSLMQHSEPVAPLNRSVGVAAIPSTATTTERPSAIFPELQDKALALAPQKTVPVVPLTAAPASGDLLSPPSLIDDPERAAPATGKTKLSKLAGAEESQRKAKRPTAQLALSVQPWGEVYVNGKRQGVTPPLRELKLPPGKHTIEVRNSAFPSYSETIVVDADTVNRIRHRFQ